DGEARVHAAVRDLGLCFLKLDERLQRVEGQGGGADDAALAQALEAVRAELAALSRNVDERLAKADLTQAGAMEKLGHEVARISERLAERIANAERRGAIAVEDVAEQIGRVAERIHQRQERAAEDVTERFRQADERTARLLEEMRAQIDASFAAARTPAAPRPAPAPLIEEPTFAEPQGSTREVIEQARARASLEPKPARNEGFSLFTPKKKPRKGGGSTTLQTALFVTGAAAALGAGVASYRLGVAEPPTSPVSVPGEPATARAAVALASEGGEKAAVKPDAAGLYADAVRRLEAREPGAVEQLRQAASLGHPAAQFHLARLYESGQGVRKDDTEARRWTEQAARGGEAKAMHNLALYYFQGVGGAKDPRAAALWFRQAAEKGVTDSQYNLGRLYEEGYGVPRDTAAAYRWYLIAARAGDAEAKASVERVRALLSPEARAAAEASR
ncbi:MAG TPA: tetratricopeptide repeat protein, partial [Caulobacteraceae bacterium]|nr:tetratricopeptide repeat protein [Caulobacteraceae bacterium]